MQQHTIRQKKIIKENARYYLQLKAINEMDIEEKEAYKLKLKELELNIKTLNEINEEYAE